MKSTVIGLLLLPTVLATAARAQDAPPASTQAAALGRGDDAEIRRAADEFVAAFNRGDAKAVAACWTADGEYVDELGRVFAGREAIEKEYAAFFQEHPGVTMHVTIDSLRLPSPNVAIEEGRATLDPEPEGAPAATRYMAIHVKADGAWRMASVRDTRVDAPSNYAALEPLAWLVGDWRAEGPSGAAESSCRWVANKSFLHRSFRIRQGEHVASSGEQIIGWNPQAGCIQSWTFTSDGGHAVGAWTPAGNSWAVESTGTTGDGSPTYAVTLVTPLDADAFSWRSTVRSVAGVALPDSDEIVLRRVAAELGPTSSPSAAPSTPSTATVSTESGGPP